MTIYAKAKNAWQPVCLSYGKQKRSYVHARIVKRHKLKVVDGWVKLTWRQNESHETHETRFFVMDGEYPDFILGTKCIVEEQDDGSNLKNLLAPQGW